MPPPEETIDKAMETLDTIKLKSFNAEPTSIRPGDPVTLTWNATKPTGPVAQNVVFKLLGAKVPNVSPSDPNKAKMINPVKPMNIQFTAEAFGVKRILGTVSIDVELTNCIVNSVPDSDLAAQFAADMETEFPHVEGKFFDLNNLPNIRVRVKDTHLRVEIGGMIVNAEFDVEINNAPDGTLGVDAFIALSAENGLPRHKIMTFTPDFEFGDPADTIGLGLDEIADAIIDSVAGETVRKSVDASVRRTLLGFAGMVRDGLTLVTLAPATRRIDATLCPKTPT
jgi:hypothetical protein